MKLTIFCWLLALCAFEMAYADLQHDLVKVYFDATSDLSKDVNGKQTEIQGLVNAEKGPKMKKAKQGCVDTFQASAEALAKQPKNDLNACLSKNGEANNLEDAKSCCSKIVKAMKPQITNYYNTAKGCINNSR